jgi:protocatechuate 3,4-dioxygenase beta subunit
LMLLSVPAGYLTHEVQPGKSLNEAGQQFLRAIEPSGDKPSPPLEFTVSKGVTFTGRVLDPDGKPVELTGVESLRPLPAGSQLSWTAKGNGEFLVSGLKPQERYALGFLNRERLLAAKVSLSPPRAGEKPAALEIRLQPAGSVSGRVIGGDGKPVAGAVVRLRTKEETRGGTYFAVAGEPTVTDPEGKFTHRGLLPGWDYFVQVNAEGYAENSTLLKGAAAGQQKTLPDLVLTRADQSISGVVVDRKGRPVAGVRVHAGQKTRVTDVSGRFQINGLPRGKTQVWVNAPWLPNSYFPPPVEAGQQQGVRIVLDIDRP